MTFAWTGPVLGSSNPDLDAQVRQLEAAGDLAGARAFLEHSSAQDNPASAEAYAAFLDRHQEPGARDAYLKWVSVETDPGRKRLALKQVVLLDFMAGDKSHLAADLGSYRQAGGTDLSAPPPGADRQSFSTVTIPGPLRSFARLGALSPDANPKDLLPALARNVVTNGYEAAGNELLQQTEYLRLLTRYIAQARELQALAGRDGNIVIPNCDSEQTGALLKVLGYRMRGSCGADIVLETVNATRAFLTVDSGFPLTQLEQDLRANHRFEMPYAPSSVPVLYSADYWLNALGKSGQTDFIDAFLSDPSLCRLYLGLSHLNRITAEALRKQESPAKLKIYAHVLDFYGGMFDIQNGAAVVPGSPKAWASLVGVSPSSPGAFFGKLISSDDGWMASYFDALSRIDGPAAEYLTQPERVKRFYEALRGKITTPGPARPVFRSSTDLMLLTTALQIERSGQPHVPGDLDVWRTLFLKHPHGKYDGRLTRSAATWKSNDDLLEALFGLSRKAVENEPLKIFLALEDVDRNRAKPISPALAARLINSYRRFGPQYVIFADAPNLSESSINRYLDLCTDLSSGRDVLERADAVGSSQSLIELWRILSRQGAIPPDEQDAVFAKIVNSFLQAKAEGEVFQAGRSGVELLLASAHVGKGNSRQQELTELLVGKLRNQEGSGVSSPAADFLRVFDAQRLVPLDALFEAADRAEKGSLDAKTLRGITGPLESLQESSSLRGSLSVGEKTSFALGYWSDRHIEQERKLNLASVAKASDKKDIRSALAPLLRDSLIGILYSYYAPQGGQLLITNPLFVRSHDFIGPESAPATWRATEIAGTGWPESAGGRLTGSLVALPYALAEAEQNFLSPKREQALIWGDLVPQMIMDVTVNRWRDVTPDQIRWVSLHLERGRSLLAAAALNAAIEPKIIASFRRFATPAMAETVTDRLRSGEFSQAMLQVPAAALYGMADDPTLKDVSPDLTSLEITQLVREGNPALSRETISRVFGTPKPTLTHSFRPGLLYLRTFPALMGYSSRILAESWESNNLYYAELADRVGLPVDRLDMYIPMWNKSAIENIFATHLEDWPALQRSLNALSQSVLRAASGANPTAGINTLDN